MNLGIHLALQLGNSPIHLPLAVSTSSAHLTHINCSLRVHQLLDFDLSMKAYADVYFIPHIVMVAFCILGLVLPAPSRTTSSTKAKEQ